MDLIPTISCPYSAAWKLNIILTTSFYEVNVTTMDL